MKTESWIRVQDLFDAAADVAPERRRSYLVEESRGESEEVRAEVLRLLEAAERVGPGFLEPGATGVAFPLAPATRPGSIPSVGLQEGDVVGRYRIQRLIGSGGMGAVYAAEQDRPRRTVALKTLRPGFESPTLRQRFEHEAEVLGRLRHPGLAQVYDAGVTDAGLLYFAMEFVPGARTILVYADEERLDLAQRVQLFAEVCRAVHDGHAKGVVHRDLKPGNVLVDEEGQPKVIDFGVARTLDSSHDAEHTRAGELVGTLAYMSPEQLAGENDEVDTRTDVYALGLCLHELLAGRRPYDLEDLGLERRLEALRTQEPDVSRELPRELRWITAKALASEPFRRYDSASQLAADLQRVLDDEPVLAGPPGVRYRAAKFVRRHRLALGAAAAVVVALALGLVRASQEARRARAEAETLRGVTRAFQHVLTRSDPMENGQTLPS